jgi:hypothetical protein
MERRINSQPLGVQTLFDAPDVAVSITVTGNNSGLGLSQWYHANKVLAQGETDADRYSPNRYGTGGEPITLHPTVKAIDPETGNPITPLFQTIAWTEIAADGTRTPITNTTDSGTALYVVKSDGSLLVKKNVPYNNQVSIECQMLWTDPRTGDPHRDTKVVNLKTNLAADEVWRVSITEKTQRWNPLSGMSPLFTVSAKAYLGETDRSDDVTFVWNYMHNLGTAANPNWVEKAVDDADFPCLAYFAAAQTVTVDGVAVQKGQGTDTIVLNADYESDKLQLVCRIMQGNTLIANAQDYAHIVWSLPYAEGNAISINGDTARQTVPVMTFKVLVQAGGSQVADDILAARTRTHWRMKRDNNNASTIDKGWGMEMSARNGEMMAADGSRIVVTPEISLLSPHRILTQVIGGTKKYLYYMDNGVKKYIVQKTTD